VVRPMQTQRDERGRGKLTDVVDRDGGSAPAYGCGRDGGQQSWNRDAEGRRRLVADRGDVGVDLDGFTGTSTRTRRRGSSG
jgi:hypothetical protein